MQCKHKFMLNQTQIEKNYTRKLVNRLLFANFCKQYCGLCIHSNELNSTDKNKEKVQLSLYFVHCSFV